MLFLPVVVLVTMVPAALAQVQQTANYDDLKFSPNFGTPLGGPNTQPQDPFIYKSLNYTNWYQGNSNSQLPKGETTKSANGVIPASGMNVIGSPSYRSDQTDPETYPLKTIAVTGPYRSFDLLSFSYGCTALSTTSAVGCSAAVTGFYANGQQVPTYTFAFFQNRRSASPMFKAQLPDYFRGLKSVTFGVGDGEFGTGPTVLVLDDVTYSLNFR